MMRFRPAIPQPVARAFDRTIENLRSGERQRDGEYRLQFCR